MSSRRSRFLLVPVLVAGLTAAVCAYAFASGDSGSPAEQIEAHPGPEAFLQAHGVSASESEPAFTLENGQTVSTIHNGQTRCLLHGIGERVTGNCFSEAEIAEGEAVTVLDECGTSGRNLMEITGLAPDGTGGVRLSHSDGSTEDVAITDGAFKFEGTNPAQGEPYPTSVEWIGENGSSKGTAALPVGEGKFCLPTTG
jgi:hypothetical protein